MTQLRGLLLENSATLKMLKLHLSRSSNSLWEEEQNIYAVARSRGGSGAETPADLGEFVLVVGVDAEARHGGAGEAGAVGQLPHPTDVAHGFVPQGRGRDLHLVLLLCRSDTSAFTPEAKFTRTEEEGKRPAHPGRCWRCIQTPGCRSDSSRTGGTALCSASS